MGKKTRSLLDLLVRVRTHKALDRAVGESKDYQYTLKRQDKAYGAAAYRLGLQDGIRLAFEVKEFE